MTYLEYGVNIKAGAQSGQTTVATAGTAVVLGSGEIGGPLFVKALAGNAGMIYLGNDGADDVTSANGYELDAGEYVIYEHVNNLSDIWVDTSENGDKVCWLAGNTKV